MAILSKWICRLSVIPIKISAAFFKNRNRQVHLRSQGKCKLSPKPNNLEKKNKVGFLISKSCYKAAVIKTVSYRHTDQWNKIDGPEINP